MAVVSSIRHSAITNDYNDGASALKSFLQYAESASRGDRRTARTILEGLNALTRRSSHDDTPENVVACQLAKALRERGYAVDSDVGQSRFRCDLAVRSHDVRHYCVGILIDTDAHYANRNVAERCVTRPEIMRTFGWRVLTVLTRDWYHEPQAVLDRLERAARGEASVVEEIEEEACAAIEEVVNVEQPAATPASPPSVSSPNALEGNVRRFEMVEAGHSKFWEIAQDNLTVVVRYGRIGTSGQVLTKNFDTLPRANREVEKLTTEKLRKGYKEIPK